MISLKNTAEKKANDIMGFVGSTVMILSVIVLVLLGFFHQYPEIIGLFYPPITQ